MRRAGREPGDLGLEREPRLEPLAHVVEADLGDEEAAVDLELDEAVAASRRSASRTEPREIPSRSASSPWPRREPGASAPATISERISS